MKRIITLSAACALFAAMLSAGPVKETVHVVIDNGPNAGTYDGETDRGGCSAGLTGAGSWGNQFSLPKEQDPKKFNSLQLIVPDAKAAASGTHEFELHVGFGPILKRSAEYEILTKKGKGSGTVTVADHGATAIVTFEGTTAAGVKMHGKIDCKSVLRGR
ncbi:MAG TPA: hypothetical protein VGR95_01560 [Thermoanaerobaculia bacterium]|jgi:hypothetical protein|nr:hypothetical protein [Thermoanaerobaculia bacterium]